MIMKVQSPLRNPLLKLLMKGSVHSEVSDFSHDSGLGFSSDYEAASNISSRTLSHAKNVLDENSCDALFSIAENVDKNSLDEPPFKVPRTDYAKDHAFDPILAVAGRQLYEELTKDDKFSPSGQTKSQDLEQLQSILREVIRKVSKRHDDLQNSCVVSEFVATSNRSKSSQRAERSSGHQQNSRPPPQVPGKGSGGRRISNSKRQMLPVAMPGRQKVSQLELRILSQPEEQHRARYLTEGSRGAVKDRKGSGFPTVKLFGYSRPVTLQVFIGTDQGKVQPHLFYQASKVCGKNSTPCNQRKIDGTTVLEIDMLPEKDMTVSCDCVGILKERNVDVEQRLLQFGGTYSKKRSTRCRLVFRASVPMRDGAAESLQVVSAPILCTQPPGIPEICRKSLTECSAKGDVELFVIGKNFLKDTKVIFYDVLDDLQGDSGDGLSGGWKMIIQPEKEFLQQTHLICTVPPYHDETIRTPAKVRILVESSGKRSEAHSFTYTPVPSVLEQPQSGVIRNLSISLDTSVKQSLGLFSPIITPGMSTAAVSLAVSTPSTILSQDASQLGVNQNHTGLGLFTGVYPVSGVLADLSQAVSIDSTSGLNREAKNPIFSAPEETTVAWKAADELQTHQTTHWLKSESDSQDTTPYFVRSAANENLIPESQCLRDLLTQQPDKLQNLDLNILSDVPSRASLDLQNRHHSQPAELSFNGNAMMGTSSTEVFSSAPGSQVLMNVTTYNPPEMIQNPPQVLSGKGQPAASGTQGSIDQMSTMMTMLRDSELLQLINPSTFDNV